MSRIIKINCKRVYDVGNHYKNSADRLRQLKEEMRVISNSILSNWQGADSNNFILKYNSHINDLDVLINFLEAKSELLKGNAINHGTVDDNFSVSMKRSDMDEQLS